jgi:hypothetical protein
MLRTVALTALLACLALPAAAAASTASVDLDGHITVVAADGEENAVKITREDVALPVGVWDKAVSPGTGCWNFAAYVQCGGGSPVVRLGDRDDSLVFDDDQTDFLIGAADVEGGTGNDTITTAMSGDKVDGGEGNDTLDGFLGADTLTGGAGADRIAGSWGGDTLDGGPGVDTLIGGMDDDTLRGGGGDDVFRDNEGNDTVVGGAGVDEIKTGDGNDVIDLRDGAGGDTLLECGTGADTVQADTGDLVAGDCESVTRPQSPAQHVAAPGTPPASGAGAQNGSRPSTAASDRRAPKLRVSAKRRVLTISADEACTVAIKVGRKTMTRRLRAGRKVTVRVPGRTRALEITARDTAGNTATKRQRLRR